VAKPATKFRWLAAVQAQPADILDAKARAVAAALVMSADKGAVAVRGAGIESLVLRTALSRDSVMRALRTLERDCWLNVRRSHRATSLYLFNVPQWAAFGSHTATQKPVLGSHTATQERVPERGFGSHTATPLRVIPQEGAKCEPEYVWEEPLRGPAIRRILEAAQSQQVSNPPPGEAS
jgi:hypothetical protein